MLIFCGESKDLLKLEKFFGEIFEIQGYVQSIIKLLKINKFKNSYFD